MSYEEFELAYRSFILFNLNQNSSSKQFAMLIKRTALDLKKIGKDSRLRGIVIRFLEYVKLSDDKYKEFEMIIEDFEEKEYSERVLPRFEDIFKFSDIVNNIIENEDITKYYDYLLTILWWRICSILPLRPKEFLRTEFNCIYNKSGVYYLKVKRTKAKSGKEIKNLSKIEDYYYDDEIAIDESLFYFIDMYRKILNEDFEYKKNIELFPSELLDKIEYRNRSIYNIKRRTLNRDLITYNDLKLNLDRFYEDVIEKEYNLKGISKYVKKDESEEYIEKVTLYDARHVAIMNLVLMGNDPLNIMYLAGHSDINTTYNYFNHVRTYATSYALGFADLVKNKVIDKERYKRNREFNSGIETFNLIMLDMKGEKITPRKVNGGYCYYANINNDKSICFFYERNHRLCKYFIGDTGKEILEEVEKIEKKLETDIKVLMDVLDDMKGVHKYNEIYINKAYKVTEKIKELSILNMKLDKENSKNGKTEKDIR